MNSRQRVPDGVLPLYRTCPRCGETKPANSFHRDPRTKDGLRSWCKVCRKDEHRRYYLTHSEEVKTRTSQHKRDHPEQRRRIAHAYQQANPARGCEYSRRWRERHREVYLAKLRTYSQAHPEKVREHARTRRLRKLGVRNGGLGPAQWATILAAWRNRCAYCGKKRPLEQEHIVPLSKGGPHTVGNVVPACRSCNGRKWTGPPPVAVQPMLLA